ncbi:hypothetical protein [Sphingopyxis fribergensis]
MVDPDAVRSLWRVEQLYDAHRRVAAAGATIVVSASGEGEKPVRIAALAPYRMHWVGGADDLATFRGDHFFDLERVAAKETLFRHREFFTGHLAAPILAQFGDAIRGNFNVFDSCLKAVAEQAHR